MFVFNMLAILDEISNLQCTFAWCPWFIYGYVVRRLVIIMIIIIALSLGHLL